MNEIDLLIAELETVSKLLTPPVELSTAIDCLDLIIGRLKSIKESK